MRIRSKVIALLSAVFLALVLVEWGVSDALLLPRFEEIERDDALTAMTRIDHALHEALAAIQVSANDWGNWADTYRFAADRNATYTRENLQPTAMKQLHLTALAVVDVRGQFIWSGALEPGTARWRRLDLFATGGLPESFPWRNSLKTDRPQQGLIVTNQGILLAAVSPILDGFAHGPSRGLVLMGRLLTPPEVKAIGARAQTEVAVAPLQPDAESVDAVVLTDTKTSVSRTFDDVHGRPALTLRVDVPRKITARARSTVAYAMAFTVGAAIVVLLLIMVTLDRIVLAPLARVTRHAVTLGHSDDLSARLNLSRSDEIGKLASEFDQMVAKLAETRRQLIDHSFSAGMAELSRGVLHNLGNAMTPLGVRAAKLQERLRAAPAGDALRAIEEARRADVDPDRLADLDEFLKLAGAELASAVLAADHDAEIIVRQAAIVQGALTEQLRSTGGNHVGETVELPAVIQQTLEIVPDASRERIRVEVDASVHAVGPVRVARTVLRLLLQNLIINASEAIHAAGRDHGTVRFSASVARDAGGRQLLIECADSGAGIAAENLERVFERGFSTKRGSGNLGIGLHWCATAIRALGGRIWATSSGPGHGATFHLALPLGDAPAVATGEAA